MDPYRARPARSPLGLAVLVLVLVVVLVGLTVLAAGIALGVAILERFSDRYQIPVFVSAGVLTAAWLAALGAVRVKRQPIQPRPAPATMELGPEPPAVANMLVSDFAVRREAVPATLLDLAARRLVDVEETAHGFAVRLRPERRDGLRPYEAAVLGLVRRRAVDGIVPAAALSTGKGGTGWWRGFRREVVADAKRRGLSEDLWDGRILRWFSVAALVPAPLVALGAAHLAPGFLYWAVATALIGALKAGGRQRHTGAGLEAASRWLGVRRQLRQGAFADLPPTAVTIWERYLAYAAALGVARDVIRALPMGADADRRTWSAYGGTWREVRIRYPRFWPPAWGSRPWLALLGSIAAAAISAGVLSILLRIGWPRAGPGFPAEGAIALQIAGLVMLATASLVAVGSAVVLARAVADLGTGERVTGLVLRRRDFGRSENSDPRSYVAIDDGRSPVVRALRLRPEVTTTSSVGEGQLVEAVITPRLGHVRSIRPL